MCTIYIVFDASHARPSLSSGSLATRALLTGATSDDDARWFDLTHVAESRSNENKKYTSGNEPDLRTSRPQHLARTLDLFFASS